LETLCSASEIVVIRAEVELPPACAGKRVITPSDLSDGGASELFAERGGLRLSWSESMRGRRPWAGVSEPASDSGE
jgi:competence protein ComEC